MASNITIHNLPPLPSYNLEPLPPLLPFISDAHLALAVPVIAYWLLSGFFYIIDEYDLFPHYRLHTPHELLKRNHAPKWDVFRDVVIQHVIQTAFGVAGAYFDPDPVRGKEDYDVAVWAQELRLAQQMVPSLFALLGLNSVELGNRVSGYSPVLAGILSGGQYSQLVSNDVQVIQPRFAAWEISAAKLIYWVLMPAVQFTLAFTIMDTWQYFLHRTMHMNHWLYTKFHSRHHRLYVPYAYGALYNHPLEGFALDTLGGGLAYLLTGLSPRQALCFFTFATCKTVDDHCGYALPWDPLFHLSSNNAAYHDIHHQSWGIKTNFSHPFFTFWDRLLGTMWRGGDVKLRYERARASADAWWEEQKLKALKEQDEQAAKKCTNSHTSPPSNGTPNLQPATAGSQSTEVPISQNPRRSPRKATSGNQASLKGLKDRVSGSLPNGVPRVESRR